MLTNQSALIIKTSHLYFTIILLTTLILYLYYVETNGNMKLYNNEEESISDYYKHNDNDNDNYKKTDNGKKKVINKISIQDNYQDDSEEDDEIDEDVIIKDKDITLTPRFLSSSTALTPYSKAFNTQCMLSNILPPSIDNILPNIGMRTSELIKYIKLHNDGVKNPDSKSLTIKCIGGFGNCLNGLVTGLIISLLTNRVFLVRWNYSIYPCFINWNINDSVHKDGDEGKQFVFVDDCFEEVDVTRKFDNIGLEELNNYFSQKKILLFTNCPLYKHLARSPKLKDKLTELGLFDRIQTKVLTTSHKESGYFTPGFLAYGSIMRTFISLSTNLFLQQTKLLSTDSYYIGLQVRMGGNMIKGVTDPVFMPPKYLPSVWKCANHIETLLPKDKPTLFYLSTDSLEVKNIARGVFGDKLIMSDGDPMHAVSGSALDKTLIDLFTLSMTDYLLVTPGSTFGSTPSMTHARLPFYVDWDTSECKITDLNFPPFRYGTKYPAF